MPHLQNQKHEGIVIFPHLKLKYDPTEKKKMAFGINPGIISIASSIIQRMAKNNKIKPFVRFSRLYNKGTGVQ